VIHHNSAWLQAHLDLLFALLEVFEARANRSRMHYIKLQIADEYGMQNQKHHSLLNFGNAAGLD
jgi:hypothetical protein